MDYQEQPPPPPLRRWLKVGWTLRASGDANPQQWIEQMATPDGCLEIIQRDGGRSRWGNDQPACFVAGLIKRQVRFEYSADASFRALRLWPWTWSALVGTPCSRFADGWLDIAHSGDASSTLTGLLGADGPDWTRAAEALACVPGHDEIAAVADAVLTQPGVAEVARASGLSLRSLQRWFERHVGMPPRTYLRVLRFQQALVAMQTSKSTSTEHAQRVGYADQAHMGRNFRALSGDTAGRLRRRAKGPFA
jgi:AraC-like DNA-binding protein